jgi:hypothetical protein
LFWSKWGLKRAEIAALPRNGAERIEADVEFSFLRFVRRCDKILQIAFRRPRFLSGKAKAARSISSALREAMKGSKWHHHKKQRRKTI